MNFRFLPLRVHALLIAFLGIKSTPAHPAILDERDIANFYRGKVVRIIVGFPPGGGADVYTRVIAGNHVFNNGAKDGTEIGILNGAVILEQLFENPGVHFDMAKFRYLAVPVSETYVMIVARRSGIVKFSDLVGGDAKPLVLGAIPNSTLEHAPLLLREALGANLKVVSGYKGSADIRLAIDSGEIDGFFNPWSTLKNTA
jgi:tripartite-type tricarboxylate transporter receptor subunit TctC